MRKQHALDNIQIKQLTAGLIADTSPLNVNAELDRILKEYVPFNGFDLYNKILIELSSFQNIIVQWLEIEVQAAEVDQYDAYMDYLRSQARYPRRPLYGSIIEGNILRSKISGSISWQQIEDIRQAVILHQERNKNNVSLISESLISTDNDRELDKVAKAKEMLLIFSGNNLHGERIMPPESYDKLIEYTVFMIKHERLPDGIESVAQINLSNSFIRYTFYLLHKELYTTNSIRKYILEFIKAFFRQFENNNEQTLYTKFSDRPKSYLHDSDIILSSIGKNSNSTLS